MDHVPGSVVLLDISAGTGEFDRSILERLNHPVVVCHGPEASQHCPLVAGGECSKFEQAHGIVFELDLDRPEHRAILRKYRALAKPDMPIRVITRPGQAEHHASLLEGVETWNHEPNVADLDGFASEVEAADRFA